VLKFCSRSSMLSKARRLKAYLSHLTGARLSWTICTVCRNPFLISASQDALFHLQM